MRIVLGFLVALAVSSGGAGVAAAGPTVWEAGFGYGVGGFGVSGDAATEGGNEGGWAALVGVHARLFDAEVDVGVGFHHGARDTARGGTWAPADPAYDGLRLGFKYHLPLAELLADRGVDWNIEAYGRLGGFKYRVRTSDSDSSWYPSIGLGLKTRMIPIMGHGPDKHHKVGPRVSFYAELSWTRMASALDDTANLDGTMQTLMIGMSVLGVGDNR